MYINNILSKFEKWNVFHKDIGVVIL